jgi:Ca2+-binding RTX toxin-like protein
MGIQDVFGSNRGNTLFGNTQGNILIGGDGPDAILGGSGRSLLMGGKGNDTIVGGAADDIVIGCDSPYKQGQNAAALMSILSEWQSADSYAVRISKLDSGTFPILGLGTTVRDDGSADRLTGGAGMDWFFAGPHASITDLQVDERIN